VVFIWSYLLWARNTRRKPPDKGEEPGSRHTATGDIQQGTLHWPRVADT
jgi:hypothetical protein